MRGEEPWRLPANALAERQLFSYVDLERRIPESHPLRPLKELCDTALRGLSKRFDLMYSKTGRPSIPPEQPGGLHSKPPWRALLLQVIYTIRSERQLVEQLDYNKDADDEPPDDPGNPTVNYHGHRRSNETHESKTDPEAGLFRKGNGKEAKLCFMGHVAVENRNGLVTAAALTQATGRAEWEAAEQKTKRKRVEEVFGWVKTIGGLRKARYRGKDRVGWMFKFCSAVGLPQVGGLQSDSNKEPGCRHLLKNKRHPPDGRPLNPKGGRTGGSYCARNKIMAGCPSAAYSTVVFPHPPRDSKSSAGRLIILSDL